MPELASSRTVAEPRPDAVLAGERSRTDSAGRPRTRWWRDALRRRLLAGSDLAAGAVATLVTVVPATGSFWAMIFIPLWPLVAKLLGLYDRDHRALRHLTADEVPALLALVATCSMLVALLLPLTPAGTLGGVTILELLITSGLTAIGFRVFTRWAWWRWTPPEQVGLIGDGPPLASLRRKFVVFREMHLNVALERQISSLGQGRDRVAELRSIASGVDRIVVAAGGVEAELIGQLKTICRRRQVKLSVVSPLRGKALPVDRLARLGDLPILEYNTWDRSRSSVLIKRTFDVVASLIGLVLFAPILLAIAIAMKVDGPGPIFFSQIRAGLDGRPFRMYKLRTMSVDAERRLDELIDLDQLEDPVFKLRDDPRVTRLGRWLRRYSVDEVPQLINVLVGEMSLVGPRPEQVELVERYTRDQRAKLGVKPGITGPMQIFGRGELTFAERLAVELDYVENATLARDLRILIHTPSAVLRGTGAF